MATALEAIGADVRCTELPGVDHDSWDPACESREIVEWMLQQRRR